MKVKLFEEYNTDYLAFNDEYLAVHKILNGPNAGKIRFIIHETGHKYSMIYGCVFILGTKYEKIPKIREITVEGFTKVATNSMESIFQKFIENMGYENIDYTEHEKRLIDNLVKNFGNKIEIIADKSKDLGEILDGLNNVQNEIFEYLKDDYNEWRLKRDVGKYNL